MASTWGRLAHGLCECSSETDSYLSGVASGRKPRGFKFFSATQEAILGTEFYEVLGGGWVGPESGFALLPWRRIYVTEQRI